MMETIELLNADPDEKSIINPGAFINFRSMRKKMEISPLPDRILFGFFPHLYFHIRQKYKPEIVKGLNANHPYLIFNYQGKKFAFLFPGIGAPFSGALLEETFALGGKIVITFGFAGILGEETSQDKLIVPSSAVRDEGTSFHYSKPERYAFPDETLTRHIQANLDNKKIAYQAGSIWTTDAPYRETPGKIRRMQQDGCIAVDMEASALFTIARFRGIKIAALFTPSDRVTETRWEPWFGSGDQNTTGPVRLFELALDILLQYPDTI